VKAPSKTNVNLGGNDKNLAQKVLGNGSGSKEMFVHNIEQVVEVPLFNDLVDNNFEQRRHNNASLINVLESAKIFNVP